MDLLHQIFGQGKELSIIQMSSRSVLLFFIAFLLIRLSGRRSFGMHMPLDNIITIMLGAVLSRAMVGASGFLPVVAASTVIVLLHRLIAFLMVHNPTVSRLVEGEKKLLFTDGKFVQHNMNAAQVCKEDVMQGVRKSALTDDLAQIESIYIERNGEISPVKRPGN